MLCKRWQSWNPMIFQGVKQTVEETKSHFTHEETEAGRWTDGLAS